MNIPETFSSDIRFNAMISVDHQEIFKKIGDINALVEEDQQRFYSSYTKQQV